MDWGGDISGYDTEPQDIIQSPKIVYEALKHYTSLYRAPSDYTKSRNNIQSPDTLYPRQKNKNENTNKKYKNNIQPVKLVDPNLKYSTRVATHIDLTHKMQYLELRTTYIN